MTQTALDEFVDLVTDRCNIHESGLDEECQFSWRSLTAPIDQREILQDPRYSAYCKEQDRRAAT